MNDESRAVAAPNTGAQDARHGEPIMEANVNMGTELIVVHVNPALKRKLRDLAWTERLSMSELVRRILADHVQLKQTPSTTPTPGQLRVLDAMRALGHPAGPAEIGKHLKVTRAAVWAHLSTLLAMGLVQPSLPQPGSYERVAGNAV